MEEEKKEEETEIETIQKSDHDKIAEILAKMGTDSKQKNPYQIYKVVFQ